MRRKVKKKLSIRTHFWTANSIKKSFKAFEIRLNFYKISALHCPLFALGITLTKAKQTKRHPLVVLPGSRVATAHLTCLLSFCFQGHIITISQKKTCHGCSNGQRVSSDGAAYYG